MRPTFPEDKLAPMLQDPRNAPKVRGPGTYSHINPERQDNTAEPIVLPQRLRVDVVKLPKDTHHGSKG